MDQHAKPNVRSVMSPLKPSVMNEAAIGLFPAGLSGWYVVLGEVGWLVLSNSVHTGEEAFAPLVSNDPAARAAHAASVRLIFKTLALK